MSRMVKMPKPSAAVREGASEVRDKLRSDLSRWTRARRIASLKPTIGCYDCDATGRLVCEACGGSGKTKVHFNEDEPSPCAHCDGTGQITCVACAGQGEVPNVHRKKMLWILALGGVAWLLILYQLWGRDILPAQRAAIMQRGEHGQSAAPGTRGGGRGVSSPGVSLPGSGGMTAPASGGMAAPGTGGMSAPPAGGGGMSMPATGGGMAAPGGYSRPPR